MKYNTTLNIKRLASTMFKAIKLTNIVQDKESGDMHISEDMVDLKLELVGVLENLRKRYPKILKDNWSNYILK